MKEVLEKIIGEISNQVYDAYSRAQEVRALAGIVGKAGLTEIDLKYMDVGDVFEQRIPNTGN